MKRWARRLVTPLFVLFLAAGVGGCSSGNGANCVVLPALQQAICLS